MLNKVCIVWAKNDQASSGICGDDRIIRDLGRWMRGSGWPGLFPRLTAGGGGCRLFLAAARVCLPAFKRAHAGRMMERLGNMPQAIAYYRLSHWEWPLKRAQELEASLNP